MISIKELAGMTNNSVINFYFSISLNHLAFLKYPLILFLFSHYLSRATLIAKQKRITLIITAIYKISFSITC